MAMSFMTIRDYLREHRPYLLIAAGFLSLAVLWAGVVMLRPMPPRTVTMVTGPEGSAYSVFGKHYREILAHEGIELRLRTTAGAVENLEMLRDPRYGVSVGFLQGGTTSEKDSPNLVSLGTVSYEPLWFFYGRVLQGKGIGGLRGKRISIGPEGSGTRVLALELLALNGIDRNFAELLSLSPQAAAEELLRGKVDVALMLTSWDSPVVRRLLADRRIELASFPRAGAYVALYPFLNKVIVPAGVGNMANNRPPMDVILLAPKASLVVRKELHPAIQYLLLDAAMQIHAGPGIFQRPGQFPAAESIDLPLSEQARQFYKTGRPFLQRYLPFWLAVLIGRLFLLLIPIVGILFPLVRFLPALYGWRIRQRIYRLYGELRFVEHALDARDAGQRVDDLAAQLKQIEEQVEHFRVPVFYADMLYILTVQLTLVRGRLKVSRE
jgi:TRAP-type uncharacterized transport system substrate-binding protein